MDAANAATKSIGENRASLRASDAHTRLMALHATKSKPGCVAMRTVPPTSNPAASRVNGFDGPLRRARRRIERWIATRTPRIPGPWVVNRRRVYILPTRYGYGFALLLLAMLLGAMNYSNSMAFALTFLLAGLGLVGMHYTHANLVNIEVRQTRVEPVFAGETASFCVELANTASVPRFALSAAWQRGAPPNAGIAPASVDLAPTGVARLSLTQPANTRGWLGAPRFAVSTEFPLGLFYAWTWVELDMACLVYPRPAARGAVLPDSAGANGSRSGSRSGQDDFAGLRAYQRGDSPRSIDWKSYARQRSPLVKQFAETLAHELWIDWSELPSQWDVEQRLSQLTRWVVDADAAGRVYGLRLPGQSHPPAAGASQRQRCLQALALFEAR